MNSKLNNWMPQMLSILRIMASLLFIEHGTEKLFGFPTPPRDLGPLMSLLGVEAILEVFGGILLLVGLKTRIVAFLLSGEMAIGYFMVFAPRGFFPVLNNGDGAILFCFIFLFFVFSGGGAWSLDNILGLDTAPGKQAPK